MLSILKLPYIIGCGPLNQGAFAIEFNHISHEDNMARGVPWVQRNVKSLKFQTETLVPVGNSNANVLMV